MELQKKIPSTAERLDGQGDSLHIGPRSRGSKVLPFPSSEPAAGHEPTYDAARGAGGAARAAELGDGSSAADELAREARRSSNPNPNPNTNTNPNPKP